LLTIISELPAVRLLAFTLIAILFSLQLSCAGSPYGVALMSESALKKQDTATLCISYAVTHTNKIEKELQRRAVFTEREWSAIKDESVFRGMSDLAIYCSQGRPYSINRSTGSWGTHSQWVYRPIDGKTFYIYTKNGVVSGWQQ